MTKHFDLIDIDEDNLPNINLSEDQKKYLKNIFKNLIEPYLLLNKNPIDVNLSSSNLYEVTNNLREESNDVLNYVKGGKILRNLVLEALDKECPIKEEEILYKTLLYIPKDYSFKVAGILFSESVFSHRIYVTKDYVFMYNLDNYFRLVNSTKLPITAIHSAYIDNNNRTDFIPFSCNVLTLKLNQNEETNLQLPEVYYLRDENGEGDSNLTGLLNSLSSVGIKVKKDNDKSFDKYFLWIVSVATFLFIIYLFITIVVPILNT